MCGTDRVGMVTALQTAGIVVYFQHGCSVEGDTSFALQQSSNSHRKLRGEHGTWERADAYREQIFSLGIQNNKLCSSMVMLVKTVCQDRVSVPNSRDVLIKGSHLFLFCNNEQVIGLSLFLNEL